MKLSTFLTFNSLALQGGFPAVYKTLKVRNFCKWSVGLVTSASATRKNANNL